MKKTTLKEQRIAAEKLALRQRLWDILLGAHGGFPMDDLEDPDGNNCIVQVVGLEAFARFMHAVETTWTDETTSKYIYPMVQLEKFETLDTATEYLHGHGFRA